MKKILFCFFFFCVIFLSNQNSGWLEPNDYADCEDSDIVADIDLDSINGPYCNNKWNKTDKGDFECCAVKYKLGKDDEVARCYLVTNTKTGRKNYKKRSLSQFDDVKIICSAYNLQYTVLFFFLIFLLF